MANYSLANIDDCILDYLIRNAETPKSITNIYNDLVNDTGIRCEDLKNQQHHERNKTKFLTSCAVIDCNVSNIHRFFKNNCPYLIYSNRSKADILKSYDNDQMIMTKSDIDNELNPDVINLIVNEYFEKNNDDLLLINVNDNETVIEYLVKIDCLGIVKRIISQCQIIDIIGLDKLLEISITNGLLEMTIELLTHKYNATIEILEKTIDNYQSVIEEKEIEIENKNKIIKQIIKNKNETPGYEKYIIAICIIIVGHYISTIFYR